MFKDRNGNCKLKIAFDFDDTLTDNLFYQLAQRLILKGHDVWIITSRSSYKTYLEICAKTNLHPRPESERNGDILEAAEKLKIKDKIIYTQGETKKDAYFNHQFDLLFDDADEWHCTPICEAGGVAVSI